MFRKQKPLEVWMNGDDSDMIDLVDQNDEGIVLKSDERNGG